MTLTIFEPYQPFLAPLYDNCISKYPNQVANCSNILACILDNITSDYAARWSAAASILAFIPTILGLISNSLDELITISYHSPVLSFLLCLSSITAFSSRLDFRSPGEYGIPFEKDAQHLQRRIDHIIKSAAKAKRKLRHQSRWIPSETELIYIFCVVLAGLSAGIWYFMSEVIRYSIVVFACPIKVNVLLYVSLSQLLSILTIVLRSGSFETRHIYIPGERCNRRYTGNDSSSVDGLIVLSTVVLEMGMQGQQKCCDRGQQCDGIVIVLRSLRHTLMRSAIQVITSLVSYGLLTYGTTVFASTSLYSASNAVRVMLFVTVSAGVARMVGSWVLRETREGRRIFLVDVPMNQFEEMAIDTQIRVQILR